MNRAPDYLKQSIKQSDGMWGGKIFQMSGRRAEHGSFKAKHLYYIMLSLFTLRQIKVQSAHVFMSQCNETDRGIKTYLDISMLTWSVCHCAASQSRYNGCRL